MPHDYPPKLVIHIRSQVKTRQSQSYKLNKNVARNSNFEILQETLHGTHHLKLLNKMYKYEMGPTRTVGATEQTQDAGQRNGQTNIWTDRVKPIYPPTTLLCGGIINNLLPVLIYQGLNKMTDISQIIIQNWSLNETG